ncbi:unnamed protein product [Ilex paraguariensis]|uniref:Uncharacterized protein n=1 Tax=Ilex paraguariensis TaxID=185542 RepID=A0ABC8SM39_9AQUA
MKGVRTAETDLSSGKVIVTGTMDGNKLVDYVYRRTKKQAKIVPQPEPEKPQEEAKAEEKKEEEKPAEEPKPEEKKEEPSENKDGGQKPAEEGKKEGGDEGNNGDNKAVEEKGGENKEEAKMEGEISTIYDEQTMQKMMYYYQPLYVIERIPPPQLFSDENPNACSII